MPRRDLTLALIVATRLDPAAKLATAQMLDRVTAREIYPTLDRLGREQAFIEHQLARRHLKTGMLVLYDVTATYLEGRCVRWLATATAATAVVAGHNW